MKLHFAKPGNHALTLVEMVVIIATLAVLAISLVPALAATRKKSQRITCLNHLMQIDMSSRVWESEHTNLHPLIASTNLGGVSEYVGHGESFRYFQVLSNELATPAILVCPADMRPPARDFHASFGNANLSYFINLDATEFDPKTVVMGDDNLEVSGGRVQSGVLGLATDRPIAWTSTRHSGRANIALADGSVQSVPSSALTNWSQTTLATNRLIIP